MKRLGWEFRFAAFLVALSVAIYLVSYAFFRNLHDIFLISITSLAFLPISVLFVSLVIDRVLVMREKRAILEKLNMVVGAFFSEVGTDLLTYFSDFDPELDKIRKNLLLLTTGLSENFWKSAEVLGVMITKLTSKGLIWRDCAVFSSKKEIFCCDCWRTRTCWSTSPLRDSFELFFI